MQPDTSFITDKIQKQDFFVSRKTVLDIVKLADLQQFLLSSVQHNSDELIKQGIATADIQNLRIQDLDNFLFTVPDSAIDSIQGWMGENCRPVLESFLARQPDKEQTARLCEYLTSLRLHMLNGFRGLPGLVERAQCFLACVADKQWHPVINVVMNFCYLRDENAEPIEPAGYYQLVCSMLDAPETVSLNDNLKAQLLIVAFCAACKKRNRKLAADLLAQIQMSDYALRPHDRYGDKLKAMFEKMFTGGSGGAQAVMPTARAHAFNDVTGLQVLAVCTNAPYGNKSEKARYAFSLVLAVRGKDEQWFRLDERERQRLFPESGSIVHFEGKNYPQLPKRQSYGVWRVAMQTLSPEQSKKVDTYFYAQQKISPAHAVLPLEHINSSDNAVAREWIEHNHDQLDIDAGGERVLRFADGLYAHTTSSYQALRNEGFTQPLRAWRNLQVENLSPELQLHIGELPAAEQTYDLVRPDKGIVSALRQLSSVTSQESTKFADVVSELGANHALDTRLEKFDTSDLDLSESEISELADLLFDTDVIAREFEQKIEERFVAIRKSLRQAQEEHRTHKLFAEEIESVYSEQRQLLDSVQERLNEIFDKRQSELQKEGRQIYEMQCLLQAGIDKTNQGEIHRLEQRVAALEKHLDS